jgi:hypothetical protein
MRQLLLIFFLSAPMLVAAADVNSPGENGTQPMTPSRVTPTAEMPAKPVLPVDPHAERKRMLTKLIDAAILMLDAKAYEQFVLAFFVEEDRKRFEKVFFRKGKIDYVAWGKKNGAKILEMLRRIAITDPAWVVDRACFPLDYETGATFSFLFNDGAWDMENHSACPKPVRPVPAIIPAEK